MLIGLYAGHHGYSALRAGIGPIPFVVALGIGLACPSQLVNFFPPRVLVIAGGVLVLGAMIYGLTLNADIPYFPNLVLPVTVGGFGIGMIVVLLTVRPSPGWASTRSARYRPSRSCCRIWAAWSCWYVIQAVITSRTLYLGGTTGPVKRMNPEQLHALDQATPHAAAVGRRGGGDRRRGRAVHRLHRSAGRPRTGGQGRVRGRRRLTFRGGIVGPTG